ncbi:MAG: 3'-5' exonuclease [Prolixibacteraceae bacterium]
MYAIIDIETTGQAAKTGKITEIAIYIHNGFEITGSFSSLINPECYIPGLITNLTGIDNEMVRNAPKFFEVAKKIVEMTTDKIFVAHNVSFDYRFVQEEFKRLGYNYERKTMCTVRMGRKFLPGHKSYSLGKLCSELNISINGRHRAAGDALATVKLFELILARKALQESKASQNQLRLF